MPKGIQEDSDDIGGSLYHGGPYTWETLAIVHSQYRVILRSVVSSGVGRGREASVLY